MNSSCKEDRLLIGYRFYQILSRAWISEELSLSLCNKSFSISIGKFAEKIIHRRSSQKKKKIYKLFHYYSLTFSKNYLGKDTIPSLSLSLQLTIINYLYPPTGNTWRSPSRKKKEERKKKESTPAMHGSWNEWNRYRVELYRRVKDGIRGWGWGQSKGGNKRMRWRWRGMVEGCSRYWGRCR